MPDWAASGLLSLHHDGFGAGRRPCEGFDGTTHLNVKPGPEDRRTSPKPVQHRFRHNRRGPSSVGCPDGEHDVPELARFLETLCDVGYLGEKRRPTVTLEMRPWAGDTPEKTASTALRKLQEAWKMVAGGA